jgi:hypothetical protein
MPRYLYSSTLWYSGIFAAAATFDASRKERRKEQWDRVIAEVRQELEQPSSARLYKDFEHHADAVDTGVDTVENEAGSYQPFNELLDDDLLALSPTSHRAAGGAVGSDALDIEEDIFCLVHPSQSQAHYPTSTGPDGLDLDWAPQSIHASDQARQMAERLRWTPKKLATVQKCTELLQLQIIQRLNRLGFEEEAATTVPDEYAQYIRQSPEWLRREFEIKLAQLLDIKKANAQLSDYRPSNASQGQPLCRYTQDSLGNFHKTAREVNQSLTKLFNQRRADKISQESLLAKVAYTLYISPAPPNLGTFNALLIGLRRVNEDKLAKRVIITMNETHVRTNEVSFATKLEFYTEHNDMSNFVRTIERIRGKHGGPMLARPDVKIESESAKRKLLRVETSGRKGKEQKVIQLPTPTPMVFRAIVNGVLKFAGFEAALSICEGMGKEGWGLCMAGLTPLLKDCADRGDWKSGLAIWKQIQALKTKSDNRRLMKEWIGIEAFAAMLRLCTKCDQRETFDRVWRQASKTGRYSMEKLTSLIKAETAQQHISPDDGPLYQGADLMQQTLNDARSAPVFDKNDRDTRYWRDYTSDAMDSLSKSTVEQSDEVRALGPTQVQSIHDQPSQIRPSQIHTRLKMLAPIDRPTVLLEQQLLGLYPPSHELDDYELRERPMNANA